jgi:predicted MFS family arabinose efflux permease
MLPEPQHQPSSDRVEWRVVGPLCLTVFAVLVHGNALAPLAADVAADLDTTVPLVGQVVTVLLATMGLVGLAAGPLADHIGHRRTMVLGLTILLSSALVMGLAPSVEVMLLGGLIAGVGASTIGVPFAMAATRWSGNGQRRALSRVQSAQTTGSVLGAPLLTAVAAATGWRGAYVVVVATYAVTILLVVRTIAPDATGERGRFSFQTVLEAYRPLAHDPAMRGLYLASALRGIGWFGPLIYLGAFLVDEHGLSLRQVGLVYMIVSGGLFLGTLAAGEWLGRFDLRRAYASTTGCLGLTWLAIYTLPLGTLPTIVMMTLSAFVAGIGWIGLTTLLASETPAGAGTTMTLNVSLYTIASALGVAVGGALISLGGYALLGLAFPAFVLLSALLAGRSPHAADVPSAGEAELREPTWVAAVGASDADCAPRGKV